MVSKHIVTLAKRLMARRCFLQSLLSGFWQNLALHVCRSSLSHSCQLYRFEGRKRGPAVQRWGSDPARPAEVWKSCRVSDTIPLGSFRSEDPRWASKRWPAHRRSHPQLTLGPAARPSAKNNSFRSSSRQLGFTVWPQGRCVVLSSAGRALNASSGCCERSPNLLSQLVPESRILVRYPG
jgi:hypothetical protein